MIEGACHCGAIRFRLAEEPEWLTRCNCSYCRRAGALWAYPALDKVTVTYDPAAATRYIQGDRTLAFVSCKTCGCTTHWESLDTQKNRRLAVNCAMAEPKDIAGIRVRLLDGADTWEYLDERTPSGAVTH
jgi:hypothetical protein